MIIKNASEIARLLFNQFYKLSIQKKNIGLIKIFPQHFIQLIFLFISQKETKQLFNKNTTECCSC